MATYAARIGPPRFPVATVSSAEAARLLSAAQTGSEEVLGVLDGAPLLQVDLDDGGGELDGLVPPAWLPCVVTGFARVATAPAPTGVDVALASGDLESGPPGWVTVRDLSTELVVLGRAVIGGTQVAVTLAQVLRTSERLDPRLALMVESLAYSTMQSGPRFRSWLAERPPPQPTDDPERVVLAEREGDVLLITLNRPRVHNAVNQRLRDELCEVLAVACADPSIRDVTLRGAGPSFCSGGDLSEFGTLPDPLTAHLTRTTRSPARLLASLGPRATAQVHGACVGAGIELAAFAGRVVATPDAQFSLPELGMWLMPGAGGTVSIPRRIGRQRTAWLALSGATLDATTALAWGLVDALAGA